MKFPIYKNIYQLPIYVSRKLVTRYLNLILNNKLLKLPCTDKKWKRFQKRPFTKPVRIGNPLKDGLKNGTAGTTGFRRENGR